MSPARKPKKPIDIYCRVSQVKGRDVTADGGTAAEQERLCRLQLAADGLEVGKVFVDLDQSGKLESRPAFDQAMERALSGQSGGIISRNLKRFGRRLTVVRDVLKLEEAGATFISCEEKLDTSTPTGRFVLTVFAALGAMELEQLTDVLNDGRRRTVDRGVHIGTVPVGYDRVDGKLVPSEHAASVVRAYEMRAAGKSITEIGDWLRDNDVPSDSRRWKNGKRWSGPGVRSLLTNRTYLGEVRSGDYVKTEAHDAIVEEGLFKRVQRVNANSSITHKGSRGGNAPALLQGIIRCATCGGAMTRDSVKRPNGEVYWQYRCRGAECDHRAAISLGKIDTFVLSLVADLEPGIIRTEDRSDEVKALEEELADVEAEISEAIEAFGTAGVSPTLQAKALAQLEARKADVEKRLSQVEATATSHAIPDEWAKDMKVTPQGILVQGTPLFHLLAADTTRGNRFLKGVLERVVVAPGRGEAHERAEVIFRGADAGSPTAAETLR